MKPKAIPIIITLVILAVLVYASAAAFFILYGKSIIEKQASQGLNKKVTISSLSLTPPFNITLRGVQVEGLLNAKSIYISPSFTVLAMGKVGLNKIQVDEPKMSFEINPPLSPDSLARAEQTADRPSSVDSKKQDFYIKRLVIRNGEFHLTDKTVGEEAMKIDVAKINFTASNLSSYIIPQATFYELKAAVPWRSASQEGRIESKGRLHVFKKEIEASIRVSGIDGLALYPYYAQWVDLKEMRFSSAKLNFASDISGAGKEVTAKCKLELSDIERKAPEGEEPSDKEKIAGLVLGFLKAAGQDKLSFEFTVKTGFDKLKFGLSGIKIGRGG